MFLIEYKKDTFVNGLYIDWVEIKNEVISFTVNGDSECIYTVDNDLLRVFLNHLNCLNNNIFKIAIEEQASK